MSSSYNRNIERMRSRERANVQQANAQRTAMANTMGQRGIQEAENFSRSLDLGAYGVMVPMVNNKNEANSIVSFSKYPPNGIRGAGFGFVHDNYISTEPIDVMKQSNENLINIIQIETKEGLDNIDEIAKLDGVDCLWVGHFDLTNFLGVPGDFRSKIYKDAITKIKNAANHNKKSLGIMVSNKKDFEYYDNFGFNIIAVGTEMSILQNAIKNLIN